MTGVHDRPKSGEEDAPASGRTVLVIGVFDLFHRGHLELLRSARSFGDRLVVVVNGDAFTTQYKRKPIYSEEDRHAIVSALREVDIALVSNSADARPVIELHAIDVIVHGDDWDHQSYLKQICVDEEYLRRHAVEMKYVPYYPGISTSAIIRRMREEPL